MNIHVAIMDDEQIFCEALTDKLRQWSKDTGNLVEITVFQNSDDFLEAFESECVFEAVFLDIKMENSSFNGMEVAHRIRTINENVAIIFLTSIPDYMSEGYCVEAIRYLLKPVNSDDLAECMERVMRKIHSALNQSFMLKQRDRIIQIPYQDILYFSGSRNNIEIYTKDATYRQGQSQKLKDLEKSLPPQFVHCHRSLIVNIENVDAIIKKNVVLRNQDQLPVSDTYSAALQSRYLQYFG